MATLVLVGGERIVVSAAVDAAVAALSQTRREEFCPFDTAEGSVHVNPTHVAYIEDD
jgi:hypothetical protein